MNEFTGLPEKNSKKELNENGDCIDYTYMHTKKKKAK
jgi:hypothetical protein